MRERQRTQRWGSRPQERGVCRMLKLVWMCDRVKNWFIYSVVQSDHRVRCSEATVYIIYI